MKIGIMGMHYGHISGMFHSAVNASNGEIVGIVESDDALCENYTADHNITRFATLDLMLAKAKPDLVIEGLAHHEKTHVIETCAAAGVHMLLDKPLCRTREELQRIKTAVTKNNIKLSTFFTSRCYGAFIALRQAIQNGDLGDLVSLITTHPHKLGASGVQLRQQVNPPALYFDADKYVGTFHDLAGHGVDQVRWLTGAEYTGVHALGTLKKHINTGLTFDHVQASFQLDNGALATATADWLTPKDARSFGDTRFIIMGTEGSAHLRAYADDHVLIVSNKSGTYEPELSPSTNHAFVENMIDAFARGKENFISTDDTLAVANACITAEESARKGGKFLAIR